MHRFHIRSLVMTLAATGLLAGAFALSSASGPPFTENDKAFYMEDSILSVLRPGLDVKILAAEVGADGTVKARVRFADARGQLLEREGINTPGVINMNMMIAYIPKDADQYVSYTTRTTAVSPLTGVSAVQAGADTGGTWAKQSDGDYIYTFGRKLPANYDRTATHTIGAYGSRNLSEFNLSTSYDDGVYHFVPAGGAPPKVRDVIRTATCNKCHGELAFHGGSRRTMEICVLCHTPQTIDPDTGNTVDMPVMTHKIHMGASLPSVRAGTPYVIYGNQMSKHDYSHIAFTADARSCLVCHEQESGAAQARNVFNASRKACGACHDDVEFDTGKNHISLPQFSDNQCARCHPGDTGEEFDTSILGAHVIPRFSKQLPGVKFEILDVLDTKPGQNPLVVFSIEDKAGNPILASQMARLNLILAGPNTDYTTYVSDSAINAGGNGYGVHWWHMSRPLPADAKGSWTIAIEGRREIKLMPGTLREVTARDTGINKQRFFSVDSSPVQARRTVVEMAKCNQCHKALAFHGENRNTIGECVICHNPTMMDSSNPRRSIELGVLVHKIHRGRDLERGYSIGNGRYVYDNIGFPGILSNCDTCHVGNSQQLPLNKGQIAVMNPFELISPAGRETAACISCHDTKAAAAHAALNTHPTLGEACSACHGASSEYSVSRVHAR